MTWLAIDFGNTHTRIARWHELRRQPELLVFPELGTSPLVPTKQAAQLGGLAYPQLKRYVTSTLKTNNLEIYRQVLAKFWAKLLQVIKTDYPNLRQLVLTAPVQANEGYLRLIEANCAQQGIDRCWWLDEPTAAALGYGVEEGIVAVVDWGGGTLDVAIVRLQGSAPAVVLAKTGYTIGGTDIDYYLWRSVAKTLPQFHHQRELVLPLLEQLKIQLSSQPEATAYFYTASDRQPLAISYTQAQLGALLQREGVLTLLTQALKEVSDRAYYRGVLQSDIKHIMLVGGTTCLPMVQAIPAQMFPWAHIHQDRPLEAVVWGAVCWAHSHGVQDYLFHTYAIRYWDQAVQDWGYHPIWQKGQTYPTRIPQVLELRATHLGQTHLELTIGELETLTDHATELDLVEGQLVAVVTGKPKIQFTPLNQGLLLPLDPPATDTGDRLRLEFQVSRQRELLITAIDLANGKVLLQSQAVAKLC
ncbi:MAG: Hsp70 family protein [Pseudanabaenaceae cyanobacterium]